MTKSEVSSCIRDEGNPGEVAPRYGRLNAVEERYGVLTTPGDSFALFSLENSAKVTGRGSKSQVKI